MHVANVDAVQGRVGEVEERQPGRQAIVAQMVPGEREDRQAAGRQAQRLHDQERGRERSQPGQRHQQIQDR